MRIYWDENYPRQYGEGVAEGIRLAYVAKDGESGMPGSRGGGNDWPGGKSRAWRRGFKAGYSSTRNVIGFGPDFGRLPR